MESAILPNNPRDRLNDGAPTLASTQGLPIGRDRMQAIVYHKYGSPQVLEFGEVDKPIVGDDDVLIRVRAASVNPYDWHYMRGEPYLARIQMGRKVRDSRLGVDVAGTVESVGSKVTEFRTGDDVFGTCKGAFAEYAIGSQSSLAHKPSNATFEQAAAVGIAGFTAIQGLRDDGNLRSGQKVLINGAAGGVGTFAVQIAKAMGAEVTAVCSTRNVDMVRSIGADHVVDYARDDFTRGDERYDLMIDIIGNHSLSRCRRVLAPKGTFVMIGGKKGRWIRPIERLLQLLIVSPFVSQTMTSCTARWSKGDLGELSHLMESGQMTSVIDRTYQLSETAEAIRYLEQGHARGKVVIVVPERS